ncbi:MAG: sulfatase [bacterium]
MPRPKPPEGLQHAGAASIALVVSVLLIVAAVLALLGARAGISANGYLDTGMRGLAALELRAGVRAGIGVALLLGAGCVLFVVWLWVVSLLLERSVRSTRRHLVSAIAAAAPWALVFAAYNYVATRLPAVFPTADIPVVAWGGIALGVVISLRRTHALWIPRFRPGPAWLRWIVMGAGAASALALLVAYGYGIVVRPASPEGKPNVLLIVMDTVRQQNMSLYGYGRKTTPHLDQFAEQCSVYDNAYAVGSWTIPNHASMFTGMYVCQHGARLGAPELRGVLTTAAEILYQDGYETLAFANNPVIAGSRGYGQGFEAYRQPWQRTFANLFRALPDLRNEPDDSGAYITGRLTRRWLANRDPSRPFFLFINYLEAHSRYWAPRDYRFAFAPENTPFTDRFTKYDFVGHACGTVRKTPDENRRSADLYDGEILYLDHRIDELIGWLRDFGVLDNTIVIITSDHGEEFGEHDLVGHEFGLYDTLLRVPLIVRYPTRLAPGRHGDGVQLIDLFSTVIDGTGSAYDSSHKVAGRSLFSGSERSSVYAENYHDYEKFRNQTQARCPDVDVSPYVVTLRSVRTGDYKLIAYSDGRLELYNDAIDPGERTNLLSEHPDIAKDLELGVERWFEQTKTPLVEMGREEDQDSEDLRKRLRALGYIQ